MRAPTPPLLLAGVLLLLASAADDLLAPLVAAAPGSAPQDPNPAGNGAGAKQTPPNVAAAEKSGAEQGGEEERLFAHAAAALGGGGDDFEDGELKTYLIIVCRANGPNGGEELKEWHASLLASLLNTTTDLVLLEALSHVGPRLVFSFQHVVSGFSARLTDREVAALSKLPWCVQALPDSTLRLTTTYTPELLGVSAPATGAWSVAGNMGEGVIVGILDNGIDPRHASFLDDGMQPPPAKWRGGCHFAGQAPCNKKLIGGRSRAPQEHGTHTSGTAVGAFVRDVSLLGAPAAGTASGMAPRAHLAFYEVCLADTCSATEVLSVTEKGAFQDGVDVISMSIGDDTQKPFYKDLIAVGSFSAVLSGVFVSTSAGNAGPLARTVTNCAPWLLTVAASTMGRRIVSKVQLGNGLVIDGENLNWYKPVGDSPLVFIAGMFSGGALNAVDVRGKIVACQRKEDPIMLAEMIQKAGGAGMISWSGPKRGAATTPVDNLSIAASRVTHADGEKIIAYINSTPNPTAALRFAGAQLNRASLPAIAEYSSRGPCNMSNVGVLKPDITGPGSVIAASIPGGANDTAPTRTFGLHSGTSMSTPHLSGIVAVIKKARPQWSPAAIKSALMTTADVTHPDGTPIVDETTGRPSCFAMGAGLVNPTRALDPGLVYDLAPADYIPYVCGLGYNESVINEIIAQPLQNVSCVTAGKIQGKDLNYPSIMVTLTPAAPETVVKRTATNVGEPVSVYSVEVIPPEGVAVEVVPNVLNFGQMRQKMEFTVKLTRGPNAAANGTAEGSLRWISGKRSVRSQIAVLFEALPN
ncbi:subtilisin-like protease SBT1.7 [Hordeum vulgare]|nr:subtilisin-like protease 4 [Hordeum vulgare subsp. vulgare]KAE8767517.1 subtilisin-like protease SBT1.7 [Hordeum vulgare]